MGNEMKDLENDLKKFEETEDQVKKAKRKPRNANKEKKEYKGLPTADGPDKTDVKNRLEYFMATHHFAPGWKREIRGILKDVL